MAIELIPGIIALVIGMFIFGNKLWFRLQLKVRPVIATFKYKNVQWEVRYISECYFATPVNTGGKNVSSLLYLSRESYKKMPAALEEDLKFALLADLLSTMSHVAYAVLSEEGLLYLVTASFSDSTETQDRWTVYEYHLTNLTADNDSRHCLRSGFLRKDILVHGDRQLQDPPTAATIAEECLWSN